jgi:hypothetical protein
MAKRANISVQMVGQRYGHRGCVSVDGVMVYATPTMPFGFTDAAGRAAAEWARRHGHVVDGWDKEPISLIGKVIAIDPGLPISEAIAIDPGLRIGAGKAASRR